MHQKMEIDRQRYHTDRCEKESIHSGHFMISDFEAEAQDDGDEVTAPVAAPDNYSPQNIIPKSNRYATNYRTGKQFRSQLNIETSLTDLFQCMSLAYRQKLTSPKWNRFKGIKLRWKEKIRLNNVIWRCWHMQFITKKNSLVCQFASPLDVDFHNKPEAVVLEGKYWKRKLNAVTAEYKKWRMFFRNQALGAAKDCQDALAEAIEWKTHSFDNGMMIDEDYMEFMSDTLFSSLSTNQPFAFPDTREIARNTNLADFIQPSLVQLQPNLDDFMDTLDPPDLFYSKLPPVPEECTTNGASDEPFKMESSFHVPSTNILPPQLSHQSDQLPSTSYSSLKSRDRLNNLSDQQLRSYQYTQQPQQNSQYMYNTYQNQYQQQEQYHQLQHHHQHHQQSAQQQQQPQQQPQQQQQQQQQQPQHHQQQQPTAARHQLQQSHHQQTIQPLSLSSSAQSYQASNASQVQPYQIPSGNSQTYQQPLASSGVTSDYSSMEYVDIHQLAYSNQTNSSSETFTSPSTEFKVPSSPSSIYNLHHNPRPTLRSNSLPLINNNSPMLPSTDEPAPMQGAKLKHRVRSRNSSGALASGRKTSVPMQSTSTDANNPSALLTQLLTSNGGSAQTSYSPSLTTQASTDSPKPSFFGFDAQVPFAYLPSHLPPVKRSRTPDHVLTSYTDQYIYKTTSPPINAKSRSVLLSSQSESSLYNLSNRSSESQRLFNVFGMPNSASCGPKAPSGRRFSTNENPYSRRDKPQTMPNASRLSSCGEMSKPHSYLHGLPHQSTSLSSMAAGVLGSASSSPKYPDSPGTSESLSLSPLNVGSPSRAPVSPPSKPSTSASPYKEHRRVCHTNAEQKRRCNIKNGFDTLHTLIPHLNHSSSSKMSKAAMLQKGADYIRQLRAERNQIEEDMENLRQQVESLNSAISNCQSLLPATGAPISRHRTTKMKEMFDDYVRRRTQEDWKFWLLSLICEPLLTSFNTMVSTASVDELCRTTLQWIEQHCSLVHLRPIVPDALRNLCTSTDALTEPSRLPEQARAAVNKRPNKN